MVEEIGLQNPSAGKVLASITTEDVDVYLKAHGIKLGDAELEDAYHQHVHDGCGNWIAEELETPLDAAMCEIIKHTKRREENNRTRPYRRYSGPSNIGPLNAALCFS